MSSIASKHLALPAHRLLLDMRFGPGAFLSTQDAARSLAAKLESVLRGSGISCNSLLMDSTYPTGTAIGNALEVIEALVVMGAYSGSIPWDSAALTQQRGIVVRQTIQLLVSEFPELSIESLTCEPLH